jgi:hypothetical protein
MTLVAGLSFGGTPAFIGDLLVSWRLPNKVRLPIRFDEEVFPANEGSFAAGLAQKLVILRPYLLLVWAGEVSVIRALVNQLNRDLPHSIDDFLRNTDRLFAALNVLPKSVEVVATIIDGEFVRPFCVNTRGFEFGDKRYYLLGSGSESVFEFLLHFTSHMPPDNSDGIASRAAMINFAGNAMMAQYASGFGLSDSWGGAFEIAYVTETGFAKVDNILVRCWSLNPDGDLGNIGASFFMHYRGSALSVSTFGDKEQTILIKSMIEGDSVGEPPTKASADWTVDLFYRVNDGVHFCTVQYEYQWSDSRSFFFFEEGNLVGWNMNKSRVEKIISKINNTDPTANPFTISSL